MLRAKDHLHRTCPNPAGDQSLPHLCQPRTRRQKRPILSVVVRPSAPEILCCSGSPRPHHSIQVDRVGLLAPHVYFTADNEPSLGWGQVVERIVGVNQFPVLERRAVIIERVKFSKRGALGEIKPLAMTAIQVLLGISYEFPKSYCPVTVYTTGRGG